MKVINKILCFLSVLVLCVPLLCFNVSAYDISGMETYPSVEDMSTYDFSSYNIQTLTDTILSKYTASSKVTDSMKTYPNYFFSYKDDSGVTSYYQFDISDINQLIDYDIMTIYYINKSIFSSDDTFYFYSYVNIGSSSSTICTFYSLSPIYIISSGSTFRAVSETGISYSRTLISLKNGLLNASGSSSSSFSDSFYFYYKSDSTSYLSPTFVGPASMTPQYFVVPFSIDGFPSFLENANSDGVYKNYFGSDNLSSLIDVKLTPEFGLDMDRFDPLTNQSDYFKFEITNNSDSAIQWCAGIYDPELVTADTMNISSLSSWCYVCRTTYYDFLVKEDKGIFRTTYTYSGALKTGSFDFHYLEPGETFSDLIFWENINIKPNVIYHFFVNAVKTDLKYASSNIDPPVTEESSDMHSVTVIEDTYYNTILEGASSFNKLDCNIYNIEFSCLSMPAFTTTVRGGNSVLNTSGNDRYLLNKNYETVSDINGLDTKINKNYTDPAILANTFNRSDVSVDIDSFSVDDVKSYITSCQSFFILIKEALLSFPAFIWALICFGLTGLIVIAVVKALL